MHKPYRIGRSVFETNGDFSIHFIDDLGDTRLIACKSRLSSDQWALMLKRPDGTVVFVAEADGPGTNIAAQSPEVAATLPTLASNEAYIAWSQSIHTFNDQLRDGTWERLIVAVTTHPIGGRLKESEQLTVALTMMAQDSTVDDVDQVVLAYQTANHELRVETELREVLKRAFRSERVTRLTDEQADLTCACGKPDCLAERLRRAILARDEKALDATIDGLDREELGRVAMTLQLTFGGPLPVLLTANLQ